MTPERRAMAAGVGMLIFGAIGWWLTGYVYSSAQALDLIEAVRSSALYLGSAMATSAATTLALMLTFVGFVHRQDRDFGRAIYLRIQTIARLSTFSLVGSVIMLLVLTLPVGEFEKLPTRWYPWLYNGIFAMVVVLAALLVATVTMLFATLTNLMAEVTPTKDV